MEQVSSGIKSTLTWFLLVLITISVPTIKDVEEHICAFLAILLLLLYLERLDLWCSNKLYHCQFCFPSTPILSVHEISTNC